MNKEKWKLTALLALAMLIAGVVVAADGDVRFYGGSYDSYAQNTALDVSVKIADGLVFKFY